MPNMEPLNSDKGNDEKVQNKERSIDDEEEERKHFQKIVNTMRCYKLHSCRKLLASLKYVNSLPPEHQLLLKNHKLHLRKVHACIEKNNDIIQLLLKDVAFVFDNQDHSDDVKSELFPVSLYDLDKLHGVFKQVYREWSVEGSEERDASFKLILDEISFRFSEEKRKENIKFLVPGAGLGRLAYEIAKRGYSCQGNEISLFMLFMSNFILNKCANSKIYKAYPWVHQSCNHFDSEDQVAPMTFPDVNPSDLPHDANFSMAAGNFVEIYTEPEAWDCIITCFFLDTAHNVINYVETIQKILKPGSTWINLGPLLYHHADLPDQDSIELSYKQIKQVILNSGFHFLKEVPNVPTPYCQNPKAMMSYMYKSVFFVCEKPSMKT